MKKVLIDTNIIIDLLAKREPFYHEAARLFSMADKIQIKIFVSSLTFANVNYILLKQLKPEEAKLILRKLLLVVSILSLDERVIQISLNDTDFKDFEDALQNFTAIENDIDVIITRNLKDYKKSKLPVFTAEQFINSIR